MTFLAPLTASKVRSISSGRHCVSTWIATSSGILPPSMMERTKSKSVCEAEGNATSISLKPMPTSRSNIRFLRSTPIGSISAWLPSRRSTEHQIGAFQMTFEGHCRSAIGSAHRRGIWKSAWLVMAEPLEPCGARLIAGDTRQRILTIRKVAKSNEGVPARSERRAAKSQDSKVGSRTAFACALMQQMEG